jgi:predicted O-linked N-acetylglucosamine transferase (SPINDLY family)
MDALEQAQRLFLDALALHESGRIAEAEPLYRQALALAPGRASVMNNLAAVYLALGRYEEAQALCASLLEHEPRDIEAIMSRGNALAKLGRIDEALASYDRLLALEPGHAEAHYNRGNALLGARRWPDALAAYDAALCRAPRHVAAHYNRGNALLALKRHEEALASYDRALEIEPGHVAALNNRGIVLGHLGRHEALVANYARLVDTAPDHPYMRGYLLNARLRLCDWSGYEASVARIAEEVRAGRRADTPFNFLAISGSPADQLRCAEICAADEYPPVAPVWRGERYRHERIRVAYVSADLYDHAIPRLIAGVLEAHDRRRFEITGISLGPEQNDAMRARLKAAFDRFIDVRDRADGEVATLLRELETDIAVDLQAYTLGCRPGIFARRGAPVQVNFLGYPGTMGAPYMDYIVADERLIPREHQQWYAEKVVYLPDCYQPNDARRAIAERVPSRAELGLPETGFVYCCFNNNHKIAPGVFEIWMRLLRAVEGSVLWLLQDNEIAARNLRREAAARGVAPERVVFAPRTGMEEHLARHRQADLFLDTLPYGAHTTASDALWAGLPVLTLLGTAFAGRVAASLLSAAGMQELIARTPEEYEALALELAFDRARHAALRARLARNRAQPLFDTDRFRRHIEAAYVTMRDRVERGAAPDSFAVPAVS